MVIASRKIGYDEVEHRDLNFGMSPETVPRHWFNNDPWITHWMNAILAAVPDGERWVMQATSKQLENLHDPSVRKAAISFIRQERSHAREHDAMNEAMVAHGIPIDRAEAVFKAIRKPLQRYLGGATQCAMAANFEHFTAVISGNARSSGTVGRYQAGSRRHAVLALRGGDGAQVSQLRRVRRGKRGRRPRLRNPHGDARSGYSPFPASGAR